MRTFPLFLLCIVLICPLLGLSGFGESNTNPFSDNHGLEEQKFGVTKGEPVDKGFVFIDGKYVDAPYVVERRGLALFVNEVMIQMPAVYVDDTGEIAPTDPTIPQSITRKTSAHDSAFQEYYHKKALFLARDHSPKEASALMRQALGSLPCVKRLQDDSTDPESTMVTFQNGETQRIKLTLLSGRRVRMDRDTVLRNLELQRQNYQQRLQKGDSFFFASGGGRISFSHGKTREILANLIQILRSNKSQDAKFAELRSRGLPMVSKDNFGSLVTNFHASSQLDERVRALQVSDEGENTTGKK